MGSYFLGGLVASLNLFVLAAKAGVRDSADTYTEAPRSADMTSAGVAPLKGSAALEPLPAVGKGDPSPAVPAKRASHCGPHGGLLLQGGGCLQNGPALSGS